MSLWTVEDLTYHARHVPNLQQAHAVASLGREIVRWLAGVSPIRILVHIKFARRFVGIPLKHAI
jgi:hypothetical protein